MGNYKKIGIYHLIITVFFSIQLNASDLKKVSLSRQTRDFHQALTLIDQYLNFKPDDSNALFTKGLVLSDLGRYSESIQVFEQLIKKYPATPELHNNHAIVLAFSGKYENSQKAFQKALHLRNNYREAHKNLDALKFAITYRKYLYQSIKKGNDLYDKKKLHLSIHNHSQKADNLKTCYKLLESQMLTREIQSDLKILGYYEGKIDGTFHAKIKLAIQAFQQFHQIPVKGYISWKLLAQIQDAIDEKKMQGDMSKGKVPQMQRTRLTQKIQHGLYDLGYSPGPQNGNFHEQTRQALNHFMTDHSIDDAPDISFTISGHIMKALYQIQGKWTIVPVESQDMCTHFIPLKQFIDSGYQPIHYIGYATILAHNTGHYIMITNSSTHCRDMKRIIGAKNN
jgi:tetratricopeptide (TPR) repeat protein